ncbi:hypothetical protein H0H92_015720 [Tricholoma furcatifolium]|nr:hypothetical protein H0H92_015720 [Tricholoma furcatifolium]
MEHGTIIDHSRDELAAKNRFESFKLGKGLPSNVAHKRHSHHRSHSRNNSSISSLPFSISTKSMNAAETSPPTNPTPSSKRNSHHKRRSSVSTRIESAEMMGVSIPDLPHSTSEDNINLGDKDSIRRRALWALEGKPDMAFSKVEIPELSTPVMEKMMFDLATTKSAPQHPVPSYGPSINTLLANKRDSFKLLGPSSSSKDQLHTLVEEEEEEEEEEENLKTHDSEPSAKGDAPPTPMTPAFNVPKVAPARPRPATLHLRPLSLTPDNLVSATNGLPTPSLTPSPRPVLKALALVPSGDESTNVTATRSSVSSSSVSHRPPLTLNLTSDNSGSAFEGSRRSSISYKSSASGETAVASHGLPTPDTATYPSFDRRYSMAIPDALRRRSSGSSSSASIDDDAFSGHSRPLSASEQHFLFKSHNALLARITDLERALSVKRMSSGGISTGSSRPASVVSACSSDYGSNAEPSDEMLRLVADLKTERDELKRDVDGWRNRVADMEKQLNVVTGRVESERREAWVARSMTGLLEVEKGTLERKLADVEKTVIDLEEDKKALEVENAHFKEQLASLEGELQRVKKELEVERQSMRKASTDVQQEVLQATTHTSESHPRLIAAKRVTSVDSDVTQVEDCVDLNPNFSFSLKSVVEDEEDEEDNGLAHYEDEDEDDEDINFQSSSSFGSEADFHASVAHVQQDVPVSVTPRSESPPVIHAPRPTHANRSSISKSWTFPMGAQVLKQTSEEEPEVDRFFGCLADDDNDGDSVLNSPSAYSYEKSKGLFASGFKYGADDEDAPFFFPLGAGTEAESPKTLDVVHEMVEEEEEVKGVEDEDMFGEAGGIQITFTPPDADDGESFDSQRSPSPSPTKPPIPIINFFDFDQEETAPFNFGRPLSSAQDEQFKDPPASPPPSSSKPFDFRQPVAAPVVRRYDFPITLPSSLQRPTSPQISSSPSSIPRPKLSRAFSSNDSTVSTPSKLNQPRTVSNPVDLSHSYATPPSRRGSNMPSFIPQAVSSPSPLRSASAGSKPKSIIAAPTSVHSSQRKPLALSNSVGKSQNSSSNPAHGSTFVPQIPVIPNSVMNARSLRSSDLHTSCFTGGEFSEMNIDLSDHFSIDTSNISIPTTATTLLQTYPSISEDFNSSIIPSHSPIPPPAQAPLSSFSSIMTSPLSARLSFQSFTNFIPLSWSQRSITPTVPATDAVEGVKKVDSVQAQPVDPAPTSLKRGFVSKEKQLERLRCRLERENPTKVRNSVSTLCKKCDDDDDFVL